MAGNEPIIPRDNPLARKLAAIGALNETYGTRAQGGAGAPIVAEDPGPQAGAGTVLPPPPVPISPEEEAALQRKFDEAWGSKPAATLGLVGPVPAPQPRRAAVAELPEGFAAIDFIHRQIVGTNGAVFPIEENEYKEILSLAFQAMKRSVVRSLSKMEASLGLKEVVDEQPAAEADAQEVPQVSGDEAGQ